MKKIIVAVLMSGIATGVFAQVTSQPSAANAQTAALPMATCPHITEIKKIPLEEIGLQPQSMDFGKVIIALFQIP